jgi:hypothetical protein
MMVAAITLVLQPIVFSKTCILQSLPLSEELMSVVFVGVGEGTVFMHISGVNCKSRCQLFGFCRAKLDLPDA